MITSVISGQPESQFRVIIDYDDEGQANQQGCTGQPLPESPEDYAGNAYEKEGKPVPYAEYLAYYGNPDRHVVLWFRIQRRCGECGTWKTVSSLCGLDFMDDDEDANCIGTFTITTVRAWPVDSYLRSEILEELPR